MIDLTLTDLTVVPLVVPATLDGPDARPFLELTELDNLVCRHDAGHDYFDHVASEALPSWQDQTDNTRLGYLAVPRRRARRGRDDHHPDRAGRHDARIRRVPAPGPLGRGHRGRAARHRRARRRRARAHHRTDVDAAPRGLGRTDAPGADGLRRPSPRTTGRRSCSCGAATRSSRPSGTASSICTDRSRPSIACSRRRTRRPGPTTGS